MSSRPVCSIMSRVQQFYAGKQIFITGGTGFLGIVLTEKLLRSCPDIGTIYLLIREKKGKSVQERIDALLVNPIFDVLRNECPDFSKKVVAVPGDITAEGLGLSAADHARIVDQVSVIFHLAATVRFNEALDTAFRFNVCSVKSIIDVAKACKNLEGGVYVSTAYSNCVRKSINEELYPPPLSYDQVTKFLEDIRTEDWSEQKMNDYTKKVLGDWPNTYSFTKAIAEGVVAEFAREIPFAVFRPSIVANTYSEPVPGWVASPFGFPGMICAVGIGLVHSIQIKENVIVDIVPVDYVCSALISCVWETANTCRRPNENIPVYNYVSGNESPVLLGKRFDRTFLFGRLYPTNSSIYYPSVIRAKSKSMLMIYQFFLEIIPALIIDQVARLFGKKLDMYKVVLKIGEAVRVFAYFLTQQWNFDNQRVQNLWKHVTPEDRLIFPFSMRNFDWDLHMMKMIQGLRKYIVGDSDDNLEDARQRHVYLYIIHTIVRLVFGAFVAWVIWKLFLGFSLMIGI